MPLLDLDIYARLDHARQYMARPPRWWPAALQADSEALEAELYAAQEAMLPRDRDEEQENA